MSDTDIAFNNGLAVGMTIRLSRSGEEYEPVCWNDSGHYNYFYIDFRHAMEEFSIGMLTESIILHDTVQVQITAFEFVRTGVYKIYADISGKVKGVTVLNKVSTLLSFATGAKLPVFSTMFYVAGLDRYERLKYAYDETTLDTDEKVVLTPNEVDVEIALEENLSISPTLDSTTVSVDVVASTTDNGTVKLV